MPESNTPIVTWEKLPSESFGPEILRARVPWGWLVVSVQPSWQEPGTPRQARTFSQPVFVADGPHEWAEGRIPTSGAAPANAREILHDLASHGHNIGSGADQHGSLEGYVEPAFRDLFGSASAGIAEAAGELRTALTELPDDDLVVRERLHRALAHLGRLSKGCPIAAHDDDCNCEGAGGDR